MLVVLSIVVMLGVTVVFIAGVFGGAPRTRRR